MLRDLEKEFSEYSKQRREDKAKAGSGSGGSGSGSGAAQGGMKTLWEELADIGRDIGEEFVEFLEQVRGAEGVGQGDVGDGQSGGELGQGRGWGVCNMWCALEAEQGV